MVFLVIFHCSKISNFIFFMSGIVYTTMVIDEVEDPRMIRNTSRLKTMYHMSKTHFKQWRELTKHTRICQYVSTVNTIHYYVVWSHYWASVIDLDFSIECSDIIHSSEWFQYSIGIN